MPTRDLPRTVAGCHDAPALSVAVRQRIEEKSAYHAIVRRGAPFPSKALIIGAIAPLGGSIKWHDMRTEAGHQLGFEAHARPVRSIVYADPAKGA